MKKLHHRALSLGLVFGLAMAAGAQAAPGEEKDKQRRVEKRRVAVVNQDGKERVIHLDGPLMRRGYLGIGLTDLTPELRTHFGVPEKVGVMVSKVEPGSPAEKAGVKVGDVLTSVGGEDVKGSWDVHLKIRSQEDGRQVPLEIWRNGRVQNLAATIEERERAELDMAQFFFKDENGDRLMFHLDRDKLQALPKGTWEWKEQDGEGPRVLMHRLGGSPREAELEKKLKELEKRIAELEKQLEKK